jgi:predicted nucleic-acid-binding Zn-ribbon protein
MMEQYNSLRNCPKCDFSDIDDDGTKSEKYVFRTCKNCGYRWAELALDQEIDE